MHLQTLLLASVVAVHAVQVCTRERRGERLENVRQELPARLPLSMADAQSWTWTSGIFEASCIAGVTMFIDSLELPKERKM